METAPLRAPQSAPVAAPAPPTTGRILRAVGAGSADAISAWLAGGPPTLAEVEWLRVQGLAPYVFQLLARHGALEQLGEAVAVSLRRAVTVAAAAESVRDHALARVLGALRAAGVAAVVLKGAALAALAYPGPECRERGDNDLWIDAADFVRASRALAGAGFECTPETGRPLPFALAFGGEVTWAGPRRNLDLLDLHFQAFFGEWCRLTAAVDQAAVWARRVPFALPEVQAARLTAEDQLLHLCVHLGINHQFTFPNLRAVLDVHLLAAVEGLDWTAVATRAREWHIATVTWTTLAMAQRLFGTPVPAAAMTALRPGLPRRAAIRCLRLERPLLQSRSEGFSWRRGLVVAAMTDRAGSLARFAARAVVPEAEWLRLRWDAPAGTPLRRLYARHWASLLLHRRS